MPALGHVPQDALRTGMADNFIRGVASDLFGSRILVGDAAFAIDEIHALSHMVENLEIDLFFHAPQPPLDYLPLPVSHSTCSGERRLRLADADRFD